MTEHALKFAGRYSKRQFSKAVARSIPKMVAELVTNADDSYKRLENLYEKGLLRERPSGLIAIRVDRATGGAAVIDEAEGLTAEAMLKEFGTYGEESTDRKLGFATRSLFGKGLRDVLFSQERGHVRSIRDSRSAVCKFLWRETPIIDPKEGPRVTPELRVSWGISRNGTKVDFRLSEGFPIPQHDSLSERLTGFYMLRKINSNPLRTVVLSTRYTNDRIEESQLRYEMPSGELLTEIREELEFEGRLLQIDGRVLRSEQAMTQGDAGYEDREGGLLVLDEDGNVLDLTLFGYDTNPFASHLFGELRVLGLGRMIRDKLNQKQPEELLTETREGFDRKTSFFRTLQKAIDAALKSLVKAEEQAQRQSSEVDLPPEVRKRHRQAFEQLNQLYRSMLGGNGGGEGIDDTTEVYEAPEGGIAFERPYLTIPAGVVTPTKVLVDPGSLGVGSEVRIAADSRVVEVDPMAFRVQPAQPGQAVSWKVIRLRGVAEDQAGTVSANCGSATAELSVTVTGRRINIPDGLVFLPSLLRLRVGQQRQLHLYVDTDQIAPGSAISLRASTETGIRVDTMPLMVGEPSPEQGVFACAVLVSGVRLGATATVTAECGGYSTLATVEVVSRRESASKPAGFFKDYRFRTLVDDNWHPTVLIEGGLIVINLCEPLNRRYFGDSVDLAKLAVTHHLYAQMRLADLILDETLTIIVTQAYGKKLPHRADPPTDIRNYVLKMKAQIGGQIHRLLVDPALLEASREALTEAAAAAER